MSDPNRKPLKIGDGEHWHFVNGEWEDAEGGLVKMPDGLKRQDGEGLQGYHFAFNREAAYRDVTVRFEFRLTSHSGAGIILRATDESHFYLLHFPNCGQASRAQNFWAAFSRMDGSGHLRIIKLELVRRVPSNNGFWLPAELELKGQKITVRVGENGYFEAQDDTYPGPGLVGLCCCANPDLRSVTVQGEPVSGKCWDEDPKQPSNWFHPRPDTKYGLWQQPQDLVRLPDGEILLNYQVMERAYEGEVTPLLTRSEDGGRTWSEPELLKDLTGPNAWRAGRLHTTPAGRLIGMVETEQGWAAAESTDGARSWSDFEPLGIPPSAAGVEKLSIGPQPFLNLKDGSMLLFAYGQHKSTHTDLALYSWSSHHCQSFAFRSTDDGHSWSGPAELDFPGPFKDEGKYEPNLDNTEVSAVQMGDGRIMALIRPVYSPWMWETWSDDGGVCWGPTLRGPFAGYAAPGILRTASGVVLVAHRLPMLTIHCSYDDGETWDQGTVIDGAHWVMGQMLELEPDVVLYVYWDSFESLMRGQLLRVTSSGLGPVR